MSSSQHSETSLAIEAPTGLLPWCRQSWQSCLGQEIGNDEHFLDAGGDSLLAVRILSRVAETLKLTVGVRDLLAAPTPRRFAGFLEARYLEEYAIDGAILLPNGQAATCANPIAEVASYINASADTLAGR